MCSQPPACYLNIPSPGSAPQSLSFPILLLPWKLCQERLLCALHLLCSLLSLKPSKPKISVQVAPVCGCCLRSLLHWRAIFLFYSHKHMFPSCFWNHIYISGRLHGTSLYLVTKTWEQGYHFSSPSLYFRHLAPHLAPAHLLWTFRMNGWMNEWISSAQQVLNYSDHYPTAMSVELRQQTFMFFFFFFTIPRLWLLGSS